MATYGRSQQQEVDYLWFPMAMVTYRSYPKLPMDIGHFAVHLKVLAEASSKRWTTYGYLWLCLPIGHIQNYIWIFDSWRSLKSLGRSKQQDVDYLWLPMAMFTKGHIQNYLWILDTLHLT